MRRIAICDDEREQAQLLIDYAEEWAAAQREAVGFAVFPSAEAFLFSWEEDKAFDVLLLDIQMGEMSGIELAKELRRQGSDLPIIFITGMPEHMEEGFEVEAVHYLLKPVSREKLFPCFERAVKRGTRERALLLPTADGEETRLSQKDVVLLEAAGRRVLLTTADGTVTEVKLGFRELLSMLAPREFVQCHRSYVVGLRYVRRLQKEQLILDSGAAVPISRRLFAQVNAAFVRFYKAED